MAEINLKIGARPGLGRSSSVPEIIEMIGMQADYRSIAAGLRSRLHDRKLNWCEANADEERCKQDIRRAYNEDCRSTGILMSRAERKVRDHLSVRHSRAIQIAGREVDKAQARYEDLVGEIMEIWNDINGKRQNSFKESMRKLDMGAEVQRDAAIKRRWEINGERETALCKERNDHALDECRKEMERELKRDAAEKRREDKRKDDEELDLFMPGGKRGRMQDIEAKMPWMDVGFPSDAMKRKRQEDEDSYLFGKCMEESMNKDKAYEEDFRESEARVKKFKALAPATFEGWNGDPYDFGTRPIAKVEQHKFKWTEVVLGAKTVSHILEEMQ